MVGVVAQSFLSDGRWVRKVVDLAAPSREDVVFLIGGGNGQLAAALGTASKIVTVEPDEAIANYLYSLELVKNDVINAEPRLVLGDIPFDQVLCLHPWHLTEEVLAGLLKVPFQQAVLVMPDNVVGAFNRRDSFGTLLRATFDVTVIQSVPKNAFSPSLEFPSSMVQLSPSSRKDGVSQSLRLLLTEAGTMRGLLTRSCREFFGYTLAEAQEAVRLFDQELLRKRFWEVTESEFHKVYDWLKQG